MKTIFNRLVGLFGIYILAVLFAACPDMKNPPQIPQKQYGKALVSVSVTDNAARTVFPQVTLANVASYKLLGGINGAPETELVESFTGTGTSVSLEPGTWNFTLNAYNQSGKHILQGKTRNQQINLNETNQVSFSLSALKSGTGTIQITLNFPESAGITHITTNGINTEEFAAITGGEFVYSKEGIAAGDYFISFGLYCGDVLRTVVSELVLVRGNLTSLKTITLIGEDLNRIVTVTFNSNGGSNVPSQTVAYGDTVTRPTPDPTKSGNTFLGWYSDLDLPIAYIFTTPVTDNITLFAKWDVSLTGTVHITVPTSKEVTVAMWDSSSDGWDNNAALRINKNGTNLSPNATLSGGGGPGYYTFTVNSGDVVTFYWVNGGQYDKECAFAVYYSADPPIPAFNPSTGTTDTGRLLVSKRYNIPSGAVGNGTLMGSFTVRETTATVGQTLTADTGNLGGRGTISYQWNRDGIAIPGANNNTYTVQPADAGTNITVTVTRTEASGSVTSASVNVIIVNYTVTFDSTGGSNVPSQTVASGTPATRPTPDPTQSGCTFVDWYSNSGLTTVYNFSTPVTGNITLFAKWNINNIEGYRTVIFNSNGGSNVPSQSVASGSTVPRPADPTSKLIFENWYSNPGLTTIYNFSTPVTQNITLYAKWTRQVTFTTAETRTINLSGLSANSVYLVRVNTSTSQVTSSNTGSVQSVSPSFSLIDDVEPPPAPFDMPYRHQHHPDVMAIRANLPPIEPEPPFRPLADFIPPKIGDTRTFWVQPQNSWVQRTATLLATGTYGNIWVYNNTITTPEAQALSANFDIIYPAETNILGYEYGGGPNGTGGKDGDPKIQILVYSIGGGVLGYFWEVDYYTQSQLDSWYGTNKYKTNLSEIFYIDSSYMKSDPSLMYLTLAHEFQHMIHFNRKTVVNGRDSSTWYNETLSMMTEDVMANILGITTTNANHPVREHIPVFLATYTGVGFSEWPSSPYPYSKGYTFGAYLLRNYGGADVLRRILANNTVDATSITAALNEIEPGMTYVKAVSRLGEAMIFSGNSKPEGAHTFDKTVTTTITGYNGAYTYTIPAFDIWTIGQNSYSSSTKGPVVYSTAQRAMIGHTVLVQQGTGWNNRTGTFSVTLNKPSNTSIEMYLMVR